MTRRDIEGDSWISSVYSLGCLGVDRSSDIVDLHLGHVLRPAVRGGDDVALHLGQLLLLLLQADFSAQLIVMQSDAK